jgi:hypothetical protein
VQDKRVHPRATIEVEVKCELADGRVLSGVARDVSIGGMYIECPDDLPFGAQLTVVGVLPGMKTEARLPATVRWCKPDGFGVQFGLLGARETHAIAQVPRRQT